MDRRTAQDRIINHPRRIDTFTKIGKTALVEMYKTELAEARAFLADQPAPAPAPIPADANIYSGTGTWLNHQLAVVNGQPVAACTRKALQGGYTGTGLVNCQRCAPEIIAVGR